MCVQPITSYVRDTRCAANAGSGRLLHEARPYQKIQGYFAAPSVKNELDLLPGTTVYPGYIWGLFNGMKKWMPPIPSLLALERALALI